MTDLEGLLANVAGFDWDAGNTSKNVLGHDVSQAEAEEIFFHTPVLLVDDAKHSVHETRWLLYGSTNADRPLIASFTIRANRIRVISIRDMSRKERRVYDKAR